MSIVWMVKKYYREGEGRERGRVRERERYGEGEEKVERCHTVKFITNIVHVCSPGM